MEVDGLLVTAEDAVFFLLDVLLLVFFSWREELDGFDRFILHYLCDGSNNQYCRAYYRDSCSCEGGGGEGGEDG